MCNFQILFLHALRLHVLKFSNAPKMKKLKKLFASVLALAIAFTPVATQKCFAAETQPQVKQTVGAKDQTAEEKLSTGIRRIIGAGIVGGSVGFAVAHLPIPGSIPTFLVATPCILALDWLFK